MRVIIAAMGLDDLDQVLVTSRAQWRAWLVQNAGTSPGIWLVTYRRATGRPAPSYDDVVEEALCFGWIDSTVRSRDDRTAMQLLTPRKPTSTWSASNKARVERLIPAGLMTGRGLAAIATARANGSWEALDAVERLEVPEDLTRELDGTPGARAAWDGFPPGARKMMLWHVASAKRPQTRAGRVDAIVQAAAQGRRLLG